MEAITLSNKAKAAIASAIVAGSLAVGSQMGRPNCDYIIPGIEEVCLTEKQAAALVEKMKNPKAGFGGVTFGGDVPIVKKLK